MQLTETTKQYSFDLMPLLYVWAGIRIPDMHRKQLEELVKFGYIKDFNGQWVFTPDGSEVIESVLANLEKMKVKMNLVVELITPEEYYKAI